jgi:hypothetical protein
MTVYSWAAHQRAGTGLCCTYLHQVSHTGAPGLANMLFRVCVCCLQGLAARSVQRVWNTGDGRLKFMVIRDKECETE